MGEERIRPVSQAGGDFCALSGWRYERELGAFPYSLSCGRESMIPREGFS